MSGKVRRHGHCRVQSPAGILTNSLQLAGYQRPFDGKGGALQLVVEADHQVQAADLLPEAVSVLVDCQGALWDLRKDAAPAHDGISVLSSSWGPRTNHAASCMLANLHAQAPHPDALEAQSA